MFVVAADTGTGVEEQSLNVREVVQAAVSDIKEVFQGESVTNPGLEEVEFDATTNEWVVTGGFPRPWDYPQVNALTAFSNASGSARTQPHRVYKAIRIRDLDSVVLSVKIRAGSASALAGD